MAWRCGPEQPNQCRNCGAPERTDGIVTNLTPYTRLCADCVNRGMMAWVRDVNPSGREATKKWKAALRQTGRLK